MKSSLPQHTQYYSTSYVHEIDKETILLAKNDEIKQLYNMVTGSTNGEMEQATERCPKCAECKICMQIKDKKGTAL